MRNAGDLVTREQGRMQAGRAAPTERATSLTERDIDALWLRMAQMFGHRWASSYGTADRGALWRRGLDGLAPADLAVGLQACMAQALDWPPTLPQFRAMCRPVAERRESAAAYREFPKALPAPPPTGERLAAAKAVLAEVRARLAGRA